MQKTMGLHRVQACGAGPTRTKLPNFANVALRRRTEDKNELWILILEKAYAKLHGSYLQLINRTGFVNEALIDLTGCPSITYDLKDEYVQHFINNGFYFGQFWELLQYFYNENYLISFSTDSEEKWTNLDYDKNQS